MKVSQTSDASLRDISTPIKGCSLQRKSKQFDVYIFMDKMQPMNPVMKIPQKFSWHFLIISAKLWKRNFPFTSIGHRIRKTIYFRKIAEGIPFSKDCFHQSSGYLSSGVTSGFFVMESSGK